MTQNKHAPLTILLCCGCLLVGCQTENYSVLSATGTSIGVEISQNPATQVPQAKLGYQRGELAIVPTNRSGEKNATSSNSLGGGATEHGDVIMELRYGGIFDWGPSSGIYQRLAVGKKGVSQPGAAFMFARDANGELSKDNADAVARAAEAMAFAEKLSGKSGLATTALLGDVYSSLGEMGQKPPKGQDDAKARDLVKELDTLVRFLPDTYPFNGYKASAANVIITNPQKGAAINKVGKQFDWVLKYHSDLVDSIDRLEGLVKQPRNSFTVNGNNTMPDMASLQKELDDQKTYLRQFTDEWGKSEVVLKAVDYYISALKK